MQEDGSERGAAAVAPGQETRRSKRAKGHVPYLVASSGIYGVSGISMDIPVISIFQDPATHFTKSGDIL